MRAFSSETATPTNHHHAHDVHSTYDLRSGYNAPSMQQAYTARRWRGDDERESQLNPQAASLRNSSTLQCETYANERCYPNAPTAIHSRSDQLQFLARAADTTETRGYEHGASGIYRSISASSAAPSAGPIHALASSASFSDMCDQPPDSNESHHVLLLPPLDSRRRAMSTENNTPTALLNPSHPPSAPPEQSKPTKKPPAKKRKSTAKSLSYEEKRRSRACKVDGCENYIINRGLCFRHGGGKKCSEEGCTSSAKNAGKCWKHGGSVKCLVDDCERRGKSRGFCWAHGGGTKCSDASCTKVAVSNGYCWAHGGGKRCAYEGCKKAAYERTYNYCAKHHDQLKDGSETLEV